ncbi:hypothetical protein BGC_55070 [Burkholderia sp. 3C]
MARFGRMDKERRGAGAGQRGGDLAGDMPGFADAGHDHAAATIQQQADGADEFSVELVTQCAYRIRLDVENVAGERKRPVIIDFRYHARSITKAFVRRAGCWNRAPDGVLSSPIESPPWRPHPRSPVATP